MGLSGVAVPVSTATVSLDGKWTSSGEWADAVELLGNVTGSYFRVKHDDSFMYFLCDHVVDTRWDPVDVAWVYIDTMNNGGTKPQTDDYAFQVYFKSSTSSAIAMQKGTGAGWKDPTALHMGAASSDATNDPYSGTGHLIFEFKIPNSILPKDTTSVSVRLSMLDDATDVWTVWPPDAFLGRENPSLWGKLNFSTPIPEFSSVVPLTALALGLPLYLMGRYAKRRDDLAPKQPEKTDL